MTRTLRTTTGALIGYALGYTAPVFLHWSRPFYDPISRRWLWTEHAGAIPMGYLGQFAYAIVFSLVGGAIANLISARSVRAATLLSAWSLSALGMSLAYFAWHNWP